MNSAQAGCRGGTAQETQSNAELTTTRQQRDSASPEPGLAREGSVIEVDDGYLSIQGPIIEIDNYLSPELEVDADMEDEYEEAVDIRSVYAMSTFPRVQAPCEVEYPSGSGRDSATISSSRTLYAEDCDFVMEHGREYCSDYFLPVDQKEQTRQWVIHQVYLKLFDRELTTVPLENPRYILDIGTGIGEWAIGMAEKYPRCEVFGTDIAPIQPTHQVPFNVEFHIENAEDEWIRPADAFDLVHLRNMEGAFSDWRFIYSQAFACIRPGGWIEVVDWEDFFADKNYVSFFPEGAAVRVLAEAVMEASAIAGKPRGSHHLNRDLLVEAGFVDIQERVYDMVIGSRERSSCSGGSSNSNGDVLFCIVTGIEAQVMRLLTKYLKWDAQRVRNLCDRAVRDTKAVAGDPDRADAFVVKLRVVVGRKPLVAGQWSALTLNENGEIHEHSGDES
ncbi:hypothetical protein VTK56DRAFT_6301 [Thermocarpiscus australiensis]